MEISLVKIALTFVAGITSVLSPCVFPVLPIVVSGGRDESKYRPLLIVAGLTSAFIVMGIITSQFGSLVAGKMQYVEKGAAIIIIIFGLFTLVNINIFKKISIFQKLQTRQSGKGSGFMIGTVLGIIWIPCVGPMLSGVLAMVAADGRIVSGIMLLFIYSMGFAIPMLVAGYGAQYFRKHTGALKNNPIVFRIFSGSILIALGLWIFFKGAIIF